MHNNNQDLQGGAKMYGVPSVDKMSFLKKKFSNEGNLLMILSIHPAI